MTWKYKSIESAFEERVEDVESIFSSFRSLHEMYTTVMKTANVNANNLVAYEKAKQSATDEQERISEGLYAQGFILLTGASEALLKDVFESLVVENFTMIKSARGTNFSLPELQKIMLESRDGLDSFEHMSASFGRLTRDKLFKTVQNPAEKINFQNAQTMVEIFQQYFNLNVDTPDTIKAIHRYWQVRHCIVHTNSTIDERFVNNVKAVGLLKPKEKVHKKLIVTKSDYQAARADFVKLFQHLNQLIIDSKLESRFIQT